MKHISKKFNTRLYQLAFRVELGLITTYAAANKLLAFKNSGSWSTCRSKLYKARKMLRTMTRHDWVQYYQRTKDVNVYMVVGSDGKLR